MWKILPLNNYRGREVNSDGNKTKGPYYGMETLGRIIGQYKDIPIILNSSCSHYKNDFMSWAADAYVAKSPDSKELKEVIRNLLERRKRKELIQTRVS